MRINSVKSMQQLEQKAEERTEVVKKKFTLHGLTDVFSKINVVMLEFGNMDKSTERFNEVERGMNKVL